jgi:hypothetical protein
MTGLRVGPERGATSAPYIAELKQQKSYFTKSPKNEIRKSLFQFTEF